MTYTNEENIAILCDFIKTSKWYSEPVAHSILNAAIIYSSQIYKICDLLSNLIHVQIFIKRREGLYRLECKSFISCNPILN